MTSRTSAHLAPLCDDLVSEMTRMKGRDTTKLFCDSQASAVDRRGVQKKEEIDCDFRRLDGYLFQGRDMPADTIDQEMDAVRDIRAPVHRLMGVPFNACEDRHVLRYPLQATFHSLKYLAGVVRACRTSGVTFFRDSPVEEVTEDNGVVESSQPILRFPTASPFTPRPPLIVLTSWHSRSSAVRYRMRSIGTRKILIICTPAAGSRKYGLRTGRRRGPQRISIVLAHLFVGGKAFTELVEDQIGVDGGDATYQHHKHPFHSFAPTFSPTHGERRGLRRFRAELECMSYIAAFSRYKNMALVSGRIGQPWRKCQPPALGLSLPIRSHVRGLTPVEKASA